MKFDIETKSTIDPNAIVLLALALLTAGAGIILVARLSKR